LCSSQPVGKGRGEEAEPDHPPSVFFLRSRAANGGGAWRRPAATVHAVPEGFPALLWIFRGVIL